MNSEWKLEMKSLLVFNKQQVRARVESETTSQLALTLTLNNCFCSFDSSTSPSTSLISSKHIWKGATKQASSTYYFYLQKYNSLPLFWSWRFCFFKLVFVLHNDNNDYQDSLTHKLQAAEITLSNIQYSIFNQWIIDWAALSDSDFRLSEAASAV